jgi:hypothetical protein
MTNGMANSSSRFAILFSAVVSAICFTCILVQLHVPTAVGLADNGDFIRAMKPDGIAFIEKTPLYIAFTQFYEMTFEGENFADKLVKFLSVDYSWFDYVTSQTLFTKASKIINAGYNAARGYPLYSYNIAWLGLLYAITFCLAVYLIELYVYDKFGRGMAITAAALMLFVFCDAGHVLYYHSFYGEAAQYALTWLSIGLLLHKKFGAYYACVVLMGISKGAYMPVGIIFALLPLAWIRQSPHCWRAHLLSPVCVAALLLFGALFTPTWIEKDTNFNAVFAGVLPLSDDPASELKALGLNPDYAVLAGYETYKSEYPVDIKSPKFREDFYNNIGKGKLAAYYLTHLDKLVAALNISAKMSSKIRADYLGNMQNPTTDREKVYRFSLWEAARERLLINNLWVIAAVMLAGISICVVSIKKDAPLSLLLASIIICAGINFAIPYISNGIADLHKHLYGFICFFDIILFVVIVYAARFAKSIFINGDRSLWTGTKRKA